MRGENYLSRWLPCGTPEVRWTRLESELLKATLWVRFDKYVEIHLFNVIGNPNSIRFFNSSWWFTASNALLKSVKITSVWLLFLKALLMTEVNSRRFVDVDLRFIKSCWVGDITERHWCCSWAVISCIYEGSSMRKLSARWVPRLLTPDNKRNRETTSEQCLTLFKRNSKEFLCRFMTVDETWIHWYTPETKEQSKQWTSPG